MGAKGNQKQDLCHRGHALIAPNVRESQNGGRKCVACERAHSTASNNKVRKGIIFTEKDMQRVSDERFTTLMLEKLRGLK